MKEIIHNNDNLKEEEVTELVVRVKALLFKKGKLLIGNESGKFHFIGGHQESNETLNECLKREVVEETGIELDDNEIGNIFMKAIFMNRDWPEKGKNRKCEIYYFVVKTDKDINLDKTSYTENESNQNFAIEEIDINDAIKFIEDNIPNNEQNKVIAPDMIEAIKEYLNNQNKS